MYLYVCKKEGGKLYNQKSKTKIHPLFRFSQKKSRKKNENKQKTAVYLLPSASPTFAVPASNFRNSPWRSDGRANRTECFWKQRGAVFRFREENCWNISPMEMKAKKKREYL